MTIDGNALRAAVLGGNDGLVSNLSLVMGVAGAGADRPAIIIAGLAGLVAGALSMALGEWLSVKSARELHANQLAQQARDLREHPEREARQLGEIYRQRGIPGGLAGRLANSLVRHNPEAALQTMAREEMGIDPVDLGGSAWVAALTSFILFGLGAAVPLLAFIVTGGALAIGIAVGLSGVLLFGIGAAITRVTGRSVLFSGGRQLLFGIVAAAITFGIGSLVGIAV
ncbi:MAG: VIT1/CCC1 transporter family protein [Chloroflexota bacterium]